VTGARLVVLAGGGTGGHTVAARVIGDIARSGSCDVVWIGRPDSFESRAAAEGGHWFLPGRLTRPSASVAYVRVLHRVRCTLRRYRELLQSCGLGLDGVTAGVSRGGGTVRFQRQNHNQHKAIEHGD
jgi:hypothetical protein